MSDFFYQICLKNYYNLTKQYDSSFYSYSQKANLFDLSLEWVKTARLRYLWQTLDQLTPLSKYFLGRVEKYKNDPVFNHLYTSWETELTSYIQRIEREIDILSSKNERLLSIEEKRIMFKRKKEVLEQTVSCLDLALRLGYRPNRAGFMKSFESEDKTPSLKLYKEPERGFYDFSASKGGDIFLFYATSQQMDVKKDFASIVEELASLFGVF